ncbi:uncharacterized protein MELLADRAFT_114336 [Melampsora larici-populina 98AG31]|uniref:Secreted protein n=1 Tax=Melampsora larici-populina (strain 98AG31 / pathotype 3-4-7) TaxID=747676 RepID=F4SD30_MELLP|nr:uncharacterized protein MELLADRAFT_114336 [Melampsora larici-populina 98AG31]EGF97448.1 hypothetical protein MELLADRAFT_114336 [Melampsora larici-populina 98AG31]
MFSLHATLVLGLCIFLPSLTFAEEHPPQSAHVYWRWKDEANSDAKDSSLFTGHANITWTRKAGCEMSGPASNFRFFVSPTARVHVEAETKNKKGSTKCHAYSRTDFWIHNGDRTQKMKIRLPDICNDHDCKGPDQEIPNVQCLNGPKGRIVMNLDKWIDECFER